MNRERIFNIFIYFEGGIAQEYGMRHHRSHSSDADKLSFLQATVDADASIAHHFPLPRSFTVAEWSAHLRAGLDIRLFEEGFVHYRAHVAPIFCVTMVVDGLPRADISTDPGPYWGEKMNSDLPVVMQDWLIKYMEGKKIRLDRLINDDYFSAIRLLFNARHFVSSSKLLMSCIDTMAFVEYGDAKGNFTKWLDSFVDLTPLEITADELWEFRNSIIHMTNLSSRAVLAGKVSRIVPYVSSNRLAKLNLYSDMKEFSLYGLILAIGTGVKEWGETYNTDRNKFMKFIERYDTMISDSRSAEIIADLPEV